jgi:zinc transporter ZupT
MLTLICLAAFSATLLGGLFALYFKDKLHLILGFSAGAVIGLAFFDLLPEALELGSAFYDIDTITSLIALGFIGYMLLDRFVILHSHSNDDHNHDHDHAHERRGILGAGSLSIHSFLDGVAIGLAFQISAGVALIVTTAVLVHDFSDGINTVNMILKNKGDRILAFKWLLADALAPVFGILSTLFFTLNEGAVGIVLALFTGFFLYIGASDLLPESHHNHPRFLTTLMTLLGIGVMFTAIHFAHF